MDLQRLEQLFVERFFERQGAVAGGQGFVLERLQLRRDVTLGVLQRLPAAVVVRHFTRVRVRHFDVVAVHLVVGDAQVGNSRALALASLQRHQKVPGVGLQLPQLVEVGAMAVGDHAPVDHACRGLDVQRFLQEADTSAGKREIGSQLVKQARMRYRGDQLRQQLQRSEEHTSELQSLTNLVCRLLLEKKKKRTKTDTDTRKSYTASHNTGR